MPHLEQVVASVIRAITEAFPTQPVPLANSLTPLPHDLEDADIRAVFGGRRWTDVPDDQVARSDTALGRFSPMVFRYYLPAYLTWLLADPIQRRHSNVSEAITWALLPLQAKYQPRWWERLALFTPAQKTAVACWLQVVYWHIEPERKRDHQILRQYQKRWKPHLPGDGP